MSLPLSRSTTTSESQVAAVSNVQETTRMKSSNFMAAKKARSAVFQGENFQHCSFNIQILNQPVNQLQFRKRRAILSDDEDVQM